MKKLLPSLFMATSLFATSSAFALDCSDINEASKRYNTWDDKTREVMKEIGFPASAGFWAFKAGVKKVGNELAAIPDAVQDVTSLCDIATEKNEAIRYFKAISYLLDHSGTPLGSYFASNFDVGAKILDAANVIAAGEGLKWLSVGYAAIELKVRGENCNKNNVLFVDTDCDWSNNDFDKVIKSVDVITSSGEVMAGKVSFCRMAAAARPCFSSEPFNYERYYTVEGLDASDPQSVDYVRVTTFDGGRIYIPAKKNYMEITSSVLKVPMYINDKKQVRYNY